MSGFGTMRKENVTKKPVTTAIGRTIYSTVSNDVGGSVTWAVDSRVDICNLLKNTREQNNTFYLFDHRAKSEYEQDV